MRTRNSLPRPDSARGILARLAKLTAPVTRKRVATPEAGQENVDLLEDDEEEEPARKRPQLSFDVGAEDDDEDDSGLPEPPTPSGLLEDKDEDEDVEPPTLTFKGIEFAQATAAAEVDKPASERIERRRSRISAASSVDGGNAETDDDITAEIGRRAISEGPPTERLPRYSFGTIRMSDFGSELEVKRVSDLGRRRSSLRKSLGIDALRREEGQDNDDDDNNDDDGETRELQRLRYSPSILSVQDDFSQVAGPEDYEDTYRLELPDADKDDEEPESDKSDDDDSGIADVVSHHAAHPADHPVFPMSPEARRKQTPLETAATVTQTRAQSRRRKPLKLTRHGVPIPSLPTAFVKRIAIETQTRMGKKKPVLSREHVAALEQATEWFFEQVGEDLEAYATHGKRKKRVDESDVLLLMQRQRVLREKGSLKALAKDFLPPDLIKELDLPDEL